MVMRKIGVGQESFLPKSGNWKNVSWLGQSWSRAAATTARKAQSPTWTFFPWGIKSLSHWERGRPTEPVSWDWSISQDAGLSELKPGQSQKNQEELVTLLEKEHQVLSLSRHRRPTAAGGRKKWMGKKQKANKKTLTPGEGQETILDSNN